MGCRCGGGKNPNNNGQPKSASVSRSINQKPVKSIPRPKNLAHRQVCPVCGWMMAKTRYLDRAQNLWIEKFACANQRCVKYNQ